jgi:hypothetical protein
VGSLHAEEIDPCLHRIRREYATQAETATRRSWSKRFITIAKEIEADPTGELFKRAFPVYCTDEANQSRSDSQKKTLLRRRNPSGSRRLLKRRFALQCLSNHAGTSI